MLELGIGDFASGVSRVVLSGFHHILRVLIYQSNTETDGKTIIVKANNLDNEVFGDDGFVLANDSV